MREQKIEAMAVVFQAKGIPVIGDTFTCITDSIEKATQELQRFRLDGCSFYEIKPIRTYRVRVTANRVGVIVGGSQHIY